MLRVFWWRIAFLLLLVLFQFSFSSILFPKSPVPGLLFNLTLSLVLLRGFRESAWEWLFAVLTFDILRSGTITFFTPAAITLAYLTSFVSRRFLFEHRGSSLFLLSFLSCFGGLGYTLFLFLFMKQPFLLETMIKDFLLTFVTFIPIFLVVQWFEGRLEATRMAEFRGLRHS